MMQDDETRARADPPTPFPIPEVKRELIHFQHEINKKTFPQLKLQNPTSVVAREFRDVLDSIRTQTQTHAQRHK